MKIQQNQICYVTTSNITADKCKVVGIYRQLPKKIMVESLSTGFRYDIYPDFHCYETKEQALKAAQKYQDGYEDYIK